MNRCDVSSLNWSEWGRSKSCLQQVRWWYSILIVSRQNLWTTCVTASVLRLGSVSLVADATILDVSFITLCFLFRPNQLSAELQNIETIRFIIFVFINVAAGLNFLFTLSKKYEYDYIFLLKCQHIPISNDGLCILHFGSGVGRFIILLTPPHPPAPVWHLIL